MSVEIGAHSYGFEAAIRSFYPATETVVVGKFSSAAEGALIIPGGQHTTKVGTFPFKSILVAGGVPEDSLSKGPVTIGHDVWIGANSIVMSGAFIGSGSIVAAGAVVTKSYPPYSLITGNPATLKRRRFSDEIVEQLLQIEWWHWEQAKILEHIEDFYRPIETFLEKHAC